MGFTWTRAHGVCFVCERTQTRQCFSFFITRKPRKTPQMPDLRADAPEPSTIRLNSKDKPERNQEFYGACDAWKLEAAQVFRSLVDAMLDYIQEHGHPPKFPIRLVAANESEPKKRK